MSYVQRVLQPGEVVRHTTSIHWIEYWPGAVMLILAVAIYGYTLIGQHATRAWDFVAGGFAIIALVLLFREWFTWWTTEIAVTNLRVIYKAGFIRRTTNEMNLDKVESVRVDQSILGRILDYGDVSIIGTGEGGIGTRAPSAGEEMRNRDANEELRRVANPIELRNNITGK